MAGLEGEVALLVRISASFASPYGTAVMAELQRRGVPFVVDDATLVRQLGPARRFTGSNARALLFVVTGDATGVVPPGSRRVALVEGLTAPEQRELAELEERIGEYIRAGRLQFSERGQQALRLGLRPKLRRQSSRPEADPRPVFESGELVDMVRADLLVLDDGWARRFERCAEFQERRDNETVALFVGPLGAAAEPPGPQP